MRSACVKICPLLRPDCLDTAGPLPGGPEALPGAVAVQDGVGRCAVGRAER